MTFLFFGAVFVLATVLVVVGIVQAKKRREELSAYAASRDIELESEKFNRAFLVTCEHRKFASDVLHPRMMELLLGRPGLGWRFEGDSMTGVRRGQHDALVDAIPEFVWRDVRGQA